VHVKYPGVGAGGERRRMFPLLEFGWCRWGGGVIDPNV